MGLFFIFFVLSIPGYLLLILGFTDPKEAIMWGNRWKFKENPELSDELLRWTKYSSLAGLIILPLIWIGWFISLF